jgi:hypothetical protein
MAAMRQLRGAAMCILWLLLPACASPGAGGGTGGNGNDGGAPGDDLSAPDGAPNDLALPGGGDLAGGPLVITPLEQTLTVSVGAGTLPTLQYAATVDGVAVSPSWSVDRGEVGAIDVARGLFTPRGTLGGRATVKALFQGRVATTTITIALTQQQNGDPGFPAPKPGASGPGGVGGDGPGAPATSGQKSGLDATPVADAAVKLLYPYDGTVWPRGLWAPLLQWDPGPSRKFDAVLIELRSKHFDYKGTFKANATPFMNLPLPQAAWKTLTFSNEGAGDDITVKVVFEDSSKTPAVAVGPYTMTWHVAPATLKGTVYYNSYGTHLVANSGEVSCGGVAGECCASSCAPVVRKGPPFGAATLAIKPGTAAGATVVSDPAIIAGTASADDSGCQTCHTVSANGQKLLTQQSHGFSYNISSIYDLGSLAQTVLSGGGHNFPALAPDGSWFLSNSGGMIWGDTTSRAYKADGTLLAPQPGGLPTDLHACMPTFSPDGMHLAYDRWTSSALAGDTKTLTVMDYDPTAKSFGTPRALYTATTGTVSYSSFLPSNDAIVFEHELVGGSPPPTTTGTDYGFTRSTGQGELLWVDLASGKTHTLDKLNGAGYLPVYGTHHTAGLDAKLNYEPTVNPVASGGYAWIVFSSRRSYGNVAAIDPWASDPREYDWQHTNTTKKLWVAAIDLNPTPGSDPSHPAFYLPAQELVAGNARGFWAVDPCHADGAGCESGDECCGGYCRPGANGGGLICTNEVPMCAQEYEKCTTDSDCCGDADGIDCINGLCTWAPISLRGGAGASSSR